MAQSWQSLADKRGLQVKGNTKETPLSFQHPPQGSASVDTRDSPTMDSLASRLKEATCLPETANTADGVSTLKEAPTLEAFNKDDSKETMCSASFPAATGHEEKPDADDSASNVPRPAACTSGYVPSPGPKEQPNTNMHDVARVDHVEEAQRHDQTHFMAVPLDQLPSEAEIPEYDLHLLNLGRHADPFKMLGCHKVDSLKNDKRVVVVRVWMKNANMVELRPRAGVSDWRLPPPLEAIPLEKRSELLFVKVRSHLSF